MVLHPNTDLGRCGWQPERDWSYATSGHVWPVSCRLCTAFGTDKGPQGWKGL